ncbi:MAG: dTDP-4-dehydrorhamnose reductase [Tannerellaceae bacterium]|nr:dTDP-4-dehydrorhamnose reductase [Tannerellaceae bacterium]MCD8265010.1 dTDP-4-dehydrorhamnose reductase [Tannerellaceae bacterium]
METILITGANGQLGNALRLVLACNSSFKVLFTDVEELDICNQSAVCSYFERNKIDYIINCAAYTAVDRAEEDVALAYVLNQDAVKNLAQAAKASDARLIHISTDYVFDGKSYKPYVETDAVCPVSVYGKTKVAGEIALSMLLPEYIIIRTSWLYSEFGNNFVKTMFRLGREKESLNVVFDQVGTPTYAVDLAETIRVIIIQAAAGNFCPGIYHYSNEGVCSWYDFACKIMQLTDSSCRVFPIEGKEYPTPATRPHYSVFNKEKIKQAYNLEIPHWEESLRKCIGQLLLSVKD